MTTTWFTSDTHFHHANILAYNPNREWADIDAMNEGIIARWNSVVKPNDFVWHLGDYDMNGKDRALDLVKRLNGQIGLVSGNHDKCWVGNNVTFVKLLNQRQRYLDAGFAFVTDAAQVKMDGKVFMLSHFPYQGDHTEGDRYNEWRLRDEGRWLLHGHTHNVEQRLHDGKQIHVGMDAWDCTPVSQEQILELVW